MTRSYLPWRPRATGARRPLVTIVLSALVLAGCLSQIQPVLAEVEPVVADEQAAPVEDKLTVFLAEVRSVPEAVGDSGLGELAARSRLLTFEAIEQLLESGNRTDKDLALRLARQYHLLNGDRRPLDRVERVLGWSAEQRSMQAEAMAVKSAGKEAFFEGRFEDAIARFEDAQELFIAVGDQREQANCQLNLGAVKISAGETREGLGHLEPARKLAEQLGDDNLIAYIENNRAYALMDIGDLSGAKQAILTVLPISREAGDRRLEASLLIMLGDLCLDIGEIDEAEDYFTEGVRLGRETEDQQVVAASLLNLGIIADRKGEAAKAESFYRESMSAAITAGDTIAEAMACLALARIKLDRCADIDGVGRWLERAATLATETDSALLSAQVGMTAARLEQFHGHYQSSLALTEEVIDRLEVLDFEDLLGSVFQLRAIAYFYLADYGAAHEEFARAIRLVREREDLANEADIRMLTALFSSSLGEYEAALGEVEAAVRLSRTIGDVSKEARALLVLGDLRTRVGDYPAARKAFGRGRQLLESAANPRLQAELLLDAASMELKAGSHRRTVLELVDRAREVLPEDDLYLLTLASLIDAEVQLREGDAAAARVALDLVAGLGPAAHTVDHEWRFHLLRGMVFELVGDVPSAVAAFQASVEEVERMRGGAGRPNWKATLLENRISPYRALFRLQLKLGQVEPAYATARMAKARTFIEQLIAPVDIEAAGSAPDDAAALIPGEVADLVTLQARLGSRELIVDFFLEPDELYIFLVRHDGLALQRVEITDQQSFLAALETIRYPGRPAAGGNGTAGAFLDATARLGRMLIDPLGEWLDSATHLYLVPNGPLHAVPFPAIRRAGHFLVETHRITLLPAADLLVNRSSGRSGGTGRALVVGNPDPVAGLAPLPGAAAEAASVSAVLGEGVLLLTGAKASESYLERHAGEFDVIHLAAHGRADLRFPANSFVALSAGEGADGRWRAAEIARLEIPANLVVLSGCHTAREGGLGGHRSPGDERGGLVRAFLAAGSRAVIANLWEVDDSVSCTLLPEYYRRLAAAGPAGALAELQRDLAAGKILAADGRRLDHPFYWAGLACYGGLDRYPDPIPITQ